MTLAPGAAVRVRDDWPEARGPAHIRTPHYLRGRAGVVLRALGDFANPEQLAFGQAAEPLTLYHVRFDQAALWPDDTGGDDVPVAGGDDVLVEIFASWLQPI